MLELNEIVELQKGYQKLFDSQKLTKRAMCELVVPFRDKYGLSDLEALQIARDELTTSEISEFINRINGGTKNERKKM